MIDHRIQAGQRAGTVIVTGASSGIGRALAELLAEQGERVVGIGRDAARLAALAEGRPNIRIEAFDLARIDEIDALARRLIAQYPDTACVVNNAAIQDDVRLDDAGYDADAIAREIAVNLTAPIALTRALLTHLQSRERSVLVNVTSALASAPKRTSAVYSATKAGLRLFSEALRVQMRGSSLRVVEMVMPLVDTPMTAGRDAGKISAAQAAEAIASAIAGGAGGRIHVGKARVFALLARLSPGLAARAMLRM